MRDRICLLDYPPGSHLSEEELAQEFEISRTPVRRVLARLESEGLVQSVHGVGTIVTDVDIEELQQVYHLRLELALLIGKLSPIPRTAADLDRIRALIERCDADMRAPDQRACYLHHFAAERSELLHQAELRHHPEDHTRDLKIEALADFA